MSELETKTGRRTRAPSLIATVLMGVVLSVGMAMLPLATPALLGRDPLGAAMVGVGALPFIVLLGAVGGAIAYGLRAVPPSSEGPSRALRFGGAVLGVALAPISVLLDRTAFGPYLAFCLVPTWMMMGVALTWRVVRASSTARRFGTSAIMSIDTYFVLGILLHAPPQMARFRIIGRLATALVVAVAVYRHAAPTVSGSAND